MKLFSDAWFLFISEIKRSRVNVLVVFVLLVLTILMSGSTYYKIFELGPTINFVRIDPMADYFFILTFGSVGIFLTFIYGGGFKKDILADRLAYYRSLPISTESIVLSRIISSVVGLLVALTIYFVAMLAAFILFDDLELSNVTAAYPIHGVFLYSLMLTLNYLFVWVDLCKTYKWYTIFSFIFVFVILGISLFVTSLSDFTFTLLIATYNLSETSPLLVLLISLVIVAGTTWLTYMVVTNSLRKRNLG